MPDIDLSEERLRQLLDEGYEWEELDYKVSLDLSERQHIVELAKDVGAFQVDGGYIVIGATDDGEPSDDLSDAQVALLDESRVRAKIRRYLPEPIPLRVASHVIDGHQLVVLRVEPSPDGLAIFKADGVYRVPGASQETIAFRRGEVFVRHGSASERWEQRDWERILERRDQTRKEQWRREFAADLRAVGGGSTITPIEVSWLLDADSYAAQVIAALQVNNDVAIRGLLDALQQAALGMLAEKLRPADFDSLLDRAMCLGALLVRAVRWDLFSEWLSLMSEIYGRGFDQNGFPRNVWGTDTARLWLDVIEQAMALGGLAVRRSAWQAVRALSSVAPAGHDFQQGHYNSWIRHSLTMAARSDLFRRLEDGREVDYSLLVLAQRHADRLGCLRPDVPPGDETVLMSLCQFDFAACLIALDIGGPPRFPGPDVFFYPNFARFYSSRTEPIAELIIRESSVRAQMFRGDDQALAEAIRRIDRVARSEAVRFSGWDGFSSPTVAQFLAAHPEQD